MRPESEFCLDSNGQLHSSGFLGVPLPRARGPRSGRVLSRGKKRRATEPPSASRPIRVTPAHATKRHALSLNDRRRICVEPAPLAWPNWCGAHLRGPARLSTAHRVTAGPPLRSLPRLGGHPRRQWCDGAAAVALEATRLRRVLHCVAALRDASVAWVPQAPGPPRSRARRRGNRPPPELRS